MSLVNKNIFYTMLTCLCGIRLLFLVLASAKKDYHSPYGTYRYHFKQNDHIINLKADGTYNSSCGAWSSKGKWKIVEGKADHYPSIIFQDMKDCDGSTWGVATYIPFNQIIVSDDDGYILRRVSDE